MNLDCNDCGAPCCDAPGCGKQVGPRDLDMSCPACVRKRDEVDGIPIEQYASAQAALLEMLEPFHCYNRGSTAEVVRADRLTVGERDAVCCRLDDYSLGRKPVRSVRPERQNEGAA